MLLFAHFPVRDKEDVWPPNLKDHTVSVYRQTAVPNGRGRLGLRNLPDLCYSRRPSLDQQELIVQEGKSRKKAKCTTLSKALFSAAGI